MKILIYINSVSRFNYGNLISNVELMRGFLKKGAEVLFVVNRRTHSDVELPVDVIPLNAGGDLDRPFRLKGVVERLKPDAVIANMLTQITTASFARLLLREMKVSFLGVERDTRPWHRKVWKVPYRLFIKKVYENMDGVIAISPAVERDLTWTFFVRRGKVRLIYNPVDVEGIRKKAREPLEPELESFFEGSRVLVSVGRLDRQKEPLLALEVFRRVRERSGSVRLCFIGSGELEGELRRRVREYALEKEVLITGFRDNPFNLMERADILIHTASREGLGRVILEGMALGLPVVAFCNEDSGYREVVEGAESGLLVPFGDVESMVRKVLDLLGDAELYQRLSANALRASERFSGEKVAEEYLALIG